ncbi:hypothetical protein Golax_003304 [Gossypium laxum]|uniref:Uncharacterized protein n=1 Tax=Gossypium laxum TaxID=34288 RepID=A0A7J9AF05_9ROSI|nr:hypothetical protein [Gossypium laxum]
MFNEVDMVLTIEEYSTLLHYDFRDPPRIYWKQNVNFWEPLANLMGLPVDMVKARLKIKIVPTFFGLTLGMLWERPAVIDIWHCSRLPYTSWLCSQKLWDI